MLLSLLNQTPNNPLHRDSLPLAGERERSCRWINSSISIMVLSSSSRFGPKQVPQKRPFLCGNSRLHHWHFTACSPNQNCQHPRGGYALPRAPHAGRWPTRPAVPP